jgi:hypothetical protein
VDEISSLDAPVGVGVRVLVGGGVWVDVGVVVSPGDTSSGDKELGVKVVLAVGVGMGVFGDGVLVGVELGIEVSPDSAVIPTATGSDVGVVLQAVIKIAAKSKATLAARLSSRDIE